MNLSLHQNVIYVHYNGGIRLNRFVASVNIFVHPSEKENVLAALSKLDDIEEVYEVSGEFDIVSIVSASGLEEFRDVLQKKIMKIKGVRSTITTVILQKHKGAKMLNKLVNAKAEHT